MKDLHSTEVKNGRCALYTKYYVQNSPKKRFFYVEIQMLVKYPYVFVIMMPLSIENIPRDRFLCYSLYILFGYAGSFGTDIEYDNIEMDIVL